MTDFSNPFTGPGTVAWHSSSEPADEPVHVPASAEQRLRLHLANALSNGKPAKALHLLGLPLFEVALAGVEAVWPERPR